MLGTLLFVTASLTAGPAAPSGAVTPPEPNLATVEFEPQRTRTQPQPSQPQTTSIGSGPSQRPHTVGLGGTFAVTNYGAGGSMRYWFSDRVGLGVDASFSRPYGGSTPVTQRTTIYRGSVFQALPSVFVSLKKPNQNADLDLVPYAGAGFHYLTASGSLGYTPTSLQERTHTVGGQVFGGVEMSFKEAPSITISGEGIYYRLPGRFANAGLLEGFDFLAAVHFYLK
jgi:hypothetical protein